MNRPYLFLLAIGSGLVAAPALKNLIQKPDLSPPPKERKLTPAESGTPAASGRPAPPTGLRIVGSSDSGSQTQAPVPRFTIPPAAP